MNKFILRWLVLTAFLISPARGWQSESAQQQHPSGLEYDRVIDLLFPVTAPWSPSRCSYYLVLRFLPTDLPESQIFVCFTGKEEAFEVNLKYVEDHERNIWEQMHDIQRLTGVQKAEEFAKRISVISQDVKMPRAQMRRFMTEYRNLRLSPAFNTVFEEKGKTYEVILVDGTRYELWCEFPSNTVHYSLSGSLDGTSRKDHPLIRWMARLRNEVWWRSQMKPLN